MNEQKWRVGEIKIATTRGEQVVAGWLNGYFALDFRVFLDDDECWQGGWTLTHLPSGHIVRRIFAGLQTAKEYADALGSRGDWSFSANDKEAITLLGKAVKDVRNQFADVVIVGNVAGEIGPSNFSTPPVHP